MSKKLEPRYVTPSLESITVKGKYKVLETDFSVVRKKIEDALKEDWVLTDEIGESAILGYVGSKLMVSVAKLKLPKDPEKELLKLLKKQKKKLRAGIPYQLSITTLEHLKDGVLVEVECRPVMWFKISQYEQTNFMMNQVQEALFECRSFVKMVMSIFEAKEIEPVSVYPIIPRAEIKSRLLNLGLKKIVSLLDKAENHVVQNNFAESLKSSRTAFEKMIDWQMKKRGLGKTNSYTNDLERLKSKGFLDPEITELLKIYYQCLSVIGVHEKGIEPGIFEAQMVYGMTLIVLDYFANKLP